MLNARTSTLRAFNLCPNFNLLRQGRAPKWAVSEMPLEDKTMWKTVLAGTTVLAIAGASLAYAQQGPGAKDGAQRWKPTAADVTAFGDARIASIHAGLKLSAEQEKNWPAVESALRDLAKLRAERRTARESANRTSAEPERNPVERLAKRAQA